MIKLPVQIGVIYYFVKIQVLKKEEFVENLYKKERVNYKPKQHAMLDWDEYVERCWKYHMKLDNRLEQISFDSTEDSIAEVKERIRTREKGFVKFLDFD